MVQCPDTAGDVTVPETSGCFTILTRCYTQKILKWIIIIIIIVIIITINIIIITIFIRVFL
jgi:hypothetical protein